MDPFPHPHIYPPSPLEWSVARGLLLQWERLRVARLDDPVPTVVLPRDLPFRWSSFYGLPVLFLDVPGPLLAHPCPPHAVRSDHN